MPTFLIEPTDVLFFRDGIPMSAGQGHGAGCRLPFPSTLHEALRASLFTKYGRQNNTAAFRPAGAPRKGGWLGRGKSVPSTGSKEYQSLTTLGPWPWRKNQLLLPVPLDVTLANDGTRIHFHQLLPAAHSPNTNLSPKFLPVATAPPNKHGQPHGWWTLSQYAAYLRGKNEGTFTPVATEELWQSEHRTGLQIDAASSAAEEGRLFAGSYLRLRNDVRFYFQAELCDMKNGEQENLAALDWLLLGGDRRLVRLHSTKDDPFADFREPQIPPPAKDGPVLLKWSLITPAIFAHGHIPGWCKDTSSAARPVGQVCLPLPGRAALVSWCLGRPESISGWDMLKNEAKPPQLAAPAGSVYYFLCENHGTVAELAKKLHLHPRSDHYGEKGCGYGLVSFATQLHPTSPDIRQLAEAIFTN